MKPQKDGNKGKKRKNSKGQNDSQEKPSKVPQSSVHPTYTCSTNDTNVINKNMATLNPVDMTSFYPNIESPILQRNFQQCPLPQTQNVNFTSPMGSYMHPAQNLQPIMNSTMNTGHDTNSKIDILSQKVEDMLKKLSLLDTFGEKLGKFNNTIQTLATNIEKVTSRIGEVEKSMDFMNSQLEENKKDLTKVKTDLATVKGDVSHVKNENGNLVNTITRMQTELKNLHERHIDLQTRSMRENLVFTGIEMNSPNEESDATEEIIKKFMTEKLKLDPVLEFHRAHRFGKISERKKPDGSTFKTKPIVCRFKNFKEREVVRKAASNLKGTYYGISEQFPKEINDKRRALWPYFQEARKQNKKAFFKRDRLYIEGTEFVAPLQEFHTQEEEMEEEQSESDVYNAQGARPKNLRRGGTKFSRGGPRKLHS